MQSIAERRKALLPAAMARGTHKEYTAFIQRQRSCVSRSYDWHDGEGRCEAAHVRRAAWSGIAYKGDWCLVPLTSEEHRLTHQKGESALKPPAYFEEQMIKFLVLWIQS
jgi:hypothetical protein